MSTSNSGGLFTDVLNWFEQPFNTQGSAFNWLLFVGLMIVAAFLWHLVLLEILREV